MSQIFNQIIDTQISNPILDTQTSLSSKIPDREKLLENNSQITEIDTLMSPILNLTNRTKATDLTIIELNKQVSTLQAKISHLEQMKRQKKELKKIQKKKKKDHKKVIKKALLIGINYTGSIQQLNGCINDSKNLGDLLVANHYFKPSEIILMNDYQIGTTLYPTKVNILHQLESLIRFAEQNHSSNVKLFFSYSGHGSYLNDQNVNQDEQIDDPTDNPRKEVICPIDYLQSGYILDDDFNRNFICRLPKNTQLVALVDACYSGTMFDLRYNYKLDNKDTKITNNICPKLSSQVTLISACKDDQLGSKVNDSIKKKSLMDYQGAMTAAFINNYKHGITYTELINLMRLWIKQRNYIQIPQLSTGRHILTSGPFLLSEF